MKQSVKLIFAAGLLLASELILAKGMSVDAPYVREVPPGQMISASFMTIKNDNDKEIALIKATSDVAKTVELHEHVHEGGMMKMRPVPKIVIPAKGMTPLKPGGYHIMLIGLQRKIKAGDKIDLTLEFDNGDKEKITATVKKIMMGMKMGSGMKMKGMQNKMKGMKAKNDTSHLNPMPNLMDVFKKMPEKLNLSKEQSEAIKKGMQERGPKIKELFASLKKNESELLKEALAGKSITDLDQIADRIMQDRLGIIKGKGYCRENVKEILDDKQFSTLIDLYRTKFMPKSMSKSMQMDKEKAKMAMIKHTNPMPNLMLVIKKMGDKLDLSEEQSAKLKAWNEERGPVMERQFKAVMQFEKQIQEAALNNEPLSKIDQLAGAITMERMKIVRGKAFCRDKIEMILKPEQYKKVIKMYKENFMMAM